MAKKDQEAPVTGDQPAEKDRPTAPKSSPAADKKEGVDTPDQRPDYELVAENTKEGDPQPVEGADAFPGAHPDRVEQLQPPEQAVKAQEAARKRADEVKEIQLSVHDKQVTNVPSETLRTVFSTPQQEDEEPGAIVFQQVGNTVVVTTTGQELVFGREDFLGFLRHANAIAPTL